MDGYKVTIQVDAPDGEPLNTAAVTVRAEQVATTSADGLAEFFGGLLAALAPDVAAIVREHAGGGGAE